MAGKDFIINRRLGVVMGTATPVSPADESTGGPGRAAGGTDLERRPVSPQIWSGGPEPISNFARKNGTSPPCGAAAVRHLWSHGRAACGSAEPHLTAYPELVSCPACDALFHGREG